MTTTQLPADATSAVQEMGALAALLDKNGWKAAALIAVAVEPDAGHGGRQTVQKHRLGFEGFTTQLAAQLGVKGLRGWSRRVITRHFLTWEQAADDGLVKHAADLAYGESIGLPTTDWQERYADAPARAEREAAAQAAQITQLNQAVTQAKMARSSKHLLARTASAPPPPPPPPGGLISRSILADFVEVREILESHVADWQNKGLPRDWTTSGAGLAAELDTIDKLVAHIRQLLP